MALGGSSIDQKLHIDGNARWSEDR